MCLREMLGDMLAEILAVTGFGTAEVPVDENPVEMLSLKLSVGSMNQEVESLFRMRPERNSARQCVVVWMLRKEPHEVAHPVRLELTTSGSGGQRAIHYATGACTIELYHADFRFSSNAFCPRLNAVSSLFIASVPCSGRTLT